MLDLLLGRAGKDRRADGWSGAGWGMGGYRMGRMRTLAGPVVDEDLALTYAAVWCATRIIAETTAGLPLVTYQHSGGSNREQATDFYLYDKLKYEPSPKMGATAFREGRTAHQVNWGQGFSEIEKNSYGEMVALHPIHPSRVSPVRPTDNEPDYDYWVRNNDGSRVLLKAEDMLHIPGALSEDGIWAKGVIQYARESIGFGLATERHGSAFFGSGAQPKGVVMLPGLKDPEQRRNFRAEWKEVHGSPDSGEIAILPPEGKFTPITLSNEDNQFLETRKYNGVVTAQWYNLPPHMLKDLDRATFSNIENQGIEFVIYNLMPWPRKWEDELNRKLLTKDQRQEYFIEHNFAGLLRGDVKSRMDAYMVAIQNGLMTINECRRLENLNSIGPAGDANYVQLNMTTAERILREPDPQKAQSKPAAVPAAIEGIEGIRRDANVDAKLAAKEVLRDALSRMFAKEANSVRKAVKNKSADFSAWLVDFHSKHAAVVAESLGPAVASLAAVGLKDQAERITGLCIRLSGSRLLAAFDRDTPEQFASLLAAWPETMTNDITNQIAGGI